MEIRGIMIEPTDQVITVCAPAAPGDKVVFYTGEEQCTLHPLEEVPIYHKIACAQIRKGELVRKYGQPIGTALKDIRIGEWVHTHNLVSTSLL